MRMAEPAKIVTREERPMPKSALEETSSTACPAAPEGVLPREPVGAAVPVPSATLVGRDAAFSKSAPHSFETTLVIALLLSKLGTSCLRIDQAASVHSLQSTPFETFCGFAAIWGASWMIVFKLNDCPSDV